MKAKLTFDLNDQDDRKAHLRCIKSTDMAVVLFEITHNLKRMMLPDTASDDYIAGVENTIGQIYNMCHEYGINMDDLID